MTGFLPCLLAALGVSTARADDGPRPTDGPETEATADSAAIWTLAVGGEVSLNDPYLVSRGLRFSVGVAPVPWLSVGATGVVLPQTRDELLYLSRNILESTGIRPDWSPIYFRTQLAATAWPLRTDGDGWSAAVGPLVGVGLVHTVDDADALYVSPEDALYAATARQWHPASTLGLAARIERGRIEGRVQLERVAYVEQILSEVEEQKRPWMASLDLGLRLW